MRLIRYVVDLCSLVLLAASPVAAASPIKYVADYSVRYSGGDEFQVDGRFDKAATKLTLYFFPSDQNPQGQAAFIKSLRAWDASGRPQELKYLGEANWQGANGPISRVKYTVRARHDQASWGPGKDEVATHFDNTFFFAGNAFFLADYSWPDQPIRVQFQLPPAWRVIAPWSGGKDTIFEVPARRKLTFNLFAVSKDMPHVESAGPVKLTWLADSKLAPVEPRLRELLVSLPAAYSEFWGSAPIDKLTVFAFTDPETDGGAFLDSFALRLATPFETIDRVAWPHWLGHELQAGSAEEIARLNGADKLPAWRRIVDNDAYTAYWRDQAMDRALGRISLKVPVLTVHGLFDQEDDYGGIAAYRALEAHDPDNKLNFLVLGPWSHGQTQNDGSSLGAMKWGSDTALYFRRDVLKPFLDANLWDAPRGEPIPPVLAFETGANEWRKLSSWPAARRTLRLYLRDQGKLDFSPSAEGNSFAEYVSDPAKPVPYRLRPIRPVYASDSSWSHWLVDDQRFAETRPDVLTFVSDVLDKGVTISGPVSATLFASTTGTDADWVVKLIDVYPPEVRSQSELGGYELMISADIMRGRYRETSEAGKPIKRGSVLPYRVRMPEANHTFLPGHRIMIQVQSSWFPLYDRNPQAFVPNVAKARPEDFKAARQRIYVGGANASYVEVNAR